MFRPPALVVVSGDYTKQILELTEPLFERAGLRVERVISNDWANTKAELINSGAGLILDADLVLTKSLDWNKLARYDSLAACRGKGVYHNGGLWFSPIPVNAKIPVLTAPYWEEKVFSPFVCYDLPDEWNIPAGVNQFPRGIGIHPVGGNKLARIKTIIERYVSNES